jgi:hypothetical protein
MPINPEYLALCKWADNFTEILVGQMRVLDSLLGALCDTVPGFQKSFVEHLNTPNSVGTTSADDEEAFRKMRASLAAILKMHSKPPV